jgi:2-polyprenyl-6-methoxyphenol hydroxylase-like FAD-dependent oxidoreductase
MDHQVVIVGAGPVGLFLALLLHRNGVDVAIVERQKALYPLPRAVAFDHESRRLMGSVGISELVDQVLQTIVGRGGQDGTNFVWRDADLKCKYTILYPPSRRLLCKLMLPTAAYDLISVQ